MPATPVAPADEHHEAPVPSTPPPEREEDEAMEEEDSLQDPADDEDDDDEMPSYRQEAFGAGAESDDSDREEITAPAGKKQRTACLTAHAPAVARPPTEVPMLEPLEVIDGLTLDRYPDVNPINHRRASEIDALRVIDALTANCVALEKSIAVKEAAMMGDATSGCPAKRGIAIPRQRGQPLGALSEDRSKIQAMLSVAIASVSAKKILEDLSTRKEFRCRTSRRRMRAC